jgi:hypothetical protein
MSERLTDEELADLDKWASYDLRGDEQRQIWAATDELRDRRARDLTSFEMTVLATIRDDIAEYEHHDVNAVRVLDKLLAARKP